MGWTAYLPAGIIAVLVGFALTFASGHYHFSEGGVETKGSMR